jgi:hypothetical protein
MPPTVKQFDTYPPWIFALNDDEGPIPLNTAFAVRVYMKQVSGGASIGPCNCSITSETTFTGNTQANSPVIQGISSMNNLIEGSTLVGPGLSANTFITEIDTINNALTISPAAVTTGAISIVANRGMVSYTPTSTDTGTAGIFNVEAAIHWDSGGTQITKVPNQQNANPQFQIDPDLTGLTE